MKKRKPTEEKTSKVTRRKHVPIAIEEDKKPKDESKQNQIYEKSKDLQAQLLGLCRSEYGISREPHQDIECMIVQIDYHTSDRQPVEQFDFDMLHDRYMPHKPVIRVYGTTLEGQSILVHVHGFEPYFFVQVRDGFTEREVRILQENLNASIQAESARRGSKYVSRIEKTTRTSIYGYTPETATGNRTFLKVVMMQPNYVSTARKILEQGLLWEGLQSMQFQTFESNVLFVLRFMVDMNVSSGSWIRIRQGHYFAGGIRTSTCNMEIDVVCTDVESLGSDDRWSQIPPLRILSMDLEAQGQQGHFPNGDRDPCIQIGSMLEVRNGQEMFGNPICVIHALKTCQPLDSLALPSFCPVNSPPFLISHATEEEMLLNWADMVCAMDPDILTGYNIDNFDYPYLMKRAKALGIEKEFVFGRIKLMICQVRTRTKESQQQGKRESTEVSIPGRVSFDMLPLIREEPTKLRSYTLNSVAAHYLKLQKEDVHHSLIPKLQNGSDSDRTRLAIYCLKDAMLPLRLMDNRMFLINNLEMTRVTGITLALKMQRGQQMKVFSMLLRKARNAHLVLPTLEHKKGEDFKGAVVITPLSGYYLDPIATLDFASLYPSIMIAHNLCFTTLVTDPQNHSKEFLATSCDHTPVGQYFVKSSVKQGLLPTILKEILAARSRAKKLMKEEKDPFKKAVYDGRQLALKISANSVYGFTGAEHGLLPCKAISSSVTGYGREMLGITKDFVEKHYSKANGFPHDAKVVYGDTDSVMVYFGYSDLPTCMKLGKEAAALVSKLFISPISLEWEKCYWPYLLMNKKRYAGLYWTRPEKYDKIDCKGMEVVQRQICKLVPLVSEQVLESLLVRRNIPEAVEIVKTAVRDLYQDKVDMSLLLMSKGMGKEAKDYKANCGHIALVKKMQQRDPSTAPGMGDRVFYVYVDSTRNKKNKSGHVIEDPRFALDHKIPLCADEYVEKQLRKPLSRILKHVLKPDKKQTVLSMKKTFIQDPQTRVETKKKLMNEPEGKKKKKKEELNPLVEELWTGRHTLFRKPPHSKAVGSNHGMLKFMVRNRVCQNCHVVLSRTEAKGLCSKCEPYRDSFTLTTQADEKQLAQTCDTLHDTCVKCQEGTPYEQIDCHNLDCGIFFKRTKMDENLLQSRARLKDLLSW